MDYSRTASRVLSIIEKYGTGATFQSWNPGVYDPVEGGYIGATWNNLGVLAVFDSPSGTPGRQGLTGQDIQTILEHHVDLIGYIPSASFGTVTPTTADRVKREGQIYEILYCEETKPADTSLLWTLILKRG
ncbi:MAG: hypothetical protein AB1424_08965 [Thermodesulfobacteriota bacterium]